MVAAESLQWGRGHATAETSISPTATTNGVSLQWGRGHATAETAQKCDHDEQDEVASMGPRSCDRGDRLGAGGK